MTSHETGGIGGEKNRGACQLFDLAKPSHRRAHQELPATLGSIEQSCVQVRAQYARNESVDTNARGRPFDRERFGEGSNGRLAGSIGGNLKQPHERRKRSNIDNPAIALLNHVPAEDPAGAQSSVQVCFHDGVPFGLRKIERGHSLRPSGTVHEDFDGAEFGAYRLKEPLDAAVIRHITSLRKRPPPERHNFRGRGSYLFVAAAEVVALGRRSLTQTCDVTENDSIE